MIKYIRNHRKATAILIFVVAGLCAFFGWQRKITISQSVYDELQEEPRGERISDVEFYYSRLTAKEGEIYLYLKEKMEEFQGGIIELPHAITGKEYQRIVTALEYEGGNYYYGFVGIPLTENGFYVQQENKDILKVTEPKITKVVLFLSCAKGINLAAEFADTGKLLNIDEIQEGLSANDEEKLREIKLRQEQTDEKLDEIVDSIPKDAGKKETIEYLLKWLDKEMTFAQKSAATEEEVMHMGDMLEKVYPFNHLAGITEKKASVIGYAKIFSELCRRAGIDSHVVMGTWNSQWAGNERYVLCTVSFENQVIYVDACGQKYEALGQKRCISENEAVNRLLFADYFVYE